MLENQSFPVWGSYTQAAKLLGYKSNGPIRRMVQKNLIPSQRVPGAHPRVDLRAVVKLSFSCTNRPADKVGA